MLWLLSKARGSVAAMGVLYDYFRVADDASAINLMGELGGGPVALAANESMVDAVDLKGIEPAVTLAKLVGIVRGVGWDVDLVRAPLLWSADEQDGPWLMSIDDEARDTLASVSADQVPDLSVRWGRIEELAWGDALPEGQMAPVIEAISALARRAVDAGEHLYCWCCL